MATLPDKSHKGKQFDPSGGQKHNKNANKEKK